GDHTEPANGFSYWVSKPGGHTTGFYNKEVIENGKVRVEEGYTTDFWTKKGIEFIEKNKDKDQPFFLALTYNGPYGLSDLMLRPAKNRWAKYYENMHFQSFVADKMHPWQRSWKQFHNRQSAMERYASEVSGVDDGVGEILTTLKRYGLDSNTLVIFTGDQGWMGGQNGIWGMGDHTRPIGAHDLMMKIPLIFHHPGNIPSGRESDIIVSNYDFMPTLLNYLGISWENNNDLESPGRDFSPLLKGKKNFSWVNEMFYEMENTRAIRTDKWKYVARYPEGPYELYNVKIDPQERFNMYGQSNSQKKTAELSARLEAFFSEYADPQYDIWNGGESKVHRITSDSSNYTKNYFY
ncbi:MAG: sulfatase-like hydrolase/transferase, partial [Cyclobacteriaceae bacterium]